MSKRHIDRAALTAGRENEEEVQLLTARAHEIINLIGQKWTGTHLVSALQFTINYELSKLPDFKPEKQQFLHALRHLARPSLPSL